MKIGSIDPSQHCPVCAKQNCVAKSIAGRSVRYQCNDCSFPFANSLRQASVKISWRDKIADVAINVKEKIMNMRNSISAIVSNLPATIGDTMYNHLLRVLEKLEVDIYVLRNNASDDDKRAINTFVPEIELLRKKVEFKHQKQPIQPAPSPAVPGLAPIKTNFRKKILKNAQWAFEGKLDSVNDATDYTTHYEEQEKQISGAQVLVGGKIYTLGDKLHDDGDEEVYESWWSSPDLPSDSMLHYTQTHSIGEWWELEKSVTPKTNF